MATETWALRLRTRWQIGIRFSSLAPTSRAVAWALSTYMGPDGGGCRPTIAELAAAVGRDRSTVLRSLAELERSGWLSRRPGGGRGRASTFTPTFPAGLEEVLDEVLGNGRAGATDPVVNGRTPATVSVKQSHPCTETVAPAHRNGRTGATHSLPDSNSRLGGLPDGPAEPPPWVTLGLSWRQYRERVKEATK